MADSCPSKTLLALAAALALSGCAGGGPQLPTLSLSSASTAEAPSQQPAATPPPSAPGAAQRTANTVDQTGGEGGSATDIYSRIASGAMKCWFAVGGPLKTSYVYHATAAPPSRGGKAVIVIHQRDTTQTNPRGPKAYLVNIDPTGDASANVTTENLKMTDAFASAMTGDITRWTKGDDGCSQPSAVAGWTPSAPLPVAEATPAVKPKSAKKSKAKPASTHAKAPASQPLRTSADN